MLWVLLLTVLSVLIVLTALIVLLLRSLSMPLCKIGQKLLLLLKRKCLANELVYLRGLQLFCSLFGGTPSLGKQIGFSVELPANVFDCT